MTSPSNGQPSPATLNRNWNELLQELRVTQTGVQILTGFLLTVPFSSRFGDLTRAQTWVYAVVLSGAVLTTALVVAPVAIHRALFRRRRRYLIVEEGDRLARAGLLALAATVSGVLFLCLDLTLGRTGAFVGFGVSATVLIGLWFIAPIWLDRRSESAHNVLDETELLAEDPADEELGTGETQS